MILDDILNGVCTSLEALTPESDSDSPATFKELGKGELDDGGQDRNFTIENIRGDLRDWTSTGGKGQRYLRFNVRIRYENEGRTVRAAMMLVAQDAQRIADYLTEPGRLAVAGLHVIHSDGEWSIGRGDEPTLLYLTLPLLAEYEDNRVTS